MFLDIGAGILLSIFVGNLFGIDINAGWVLLSIVFALLPDIDMISYLLKTRILKMRVDDHRSFTHYPIAYIPLAIVIYFFMGVPVSVLFVFCVYFHFLHDTLWLGWGISWFWPITKRKYKMFPDQDGKITSRVLLSWKKEDEEEIFKKYKSPHWIRNFYFKPNIVAYVEYSIFIIGLICIYFVILYQ
jgi:hypothetical protein